MSRRPPDRGARRRRRPAQLTGSTFPLLVSTLVNTAGDGLYIAGSALFFTKGLGLPVAQVGLGLTLAGVLGLTAGIPLGRLADRRGARDILIAIQLIQAVAIASYVLVGRSLGAFVLVATICIAGMQGADAAKGALVGRLATADPVSLRALLQSVSNVGISVGTVLAGFALAAGTHLAYESLMLGDAASFLAGALLLLAVPRGRSLPRRGAAGGTRTLAGAAGPALSRPHRHQLRDGPAVLRARLRHAAVGDRAHPGPAMAGQPDAAQQHCAHRPAPGALQPQHEDPSRRREVDPARRRGPGGCDGPLQPGLRG